MKVLKIFFSIVFLFILICAIAIAFFVFLMDPNNLKPAIAQEVKRKTGYTVNILGKLSWSFFPGLAIHADRVILTAPLEHTPFMDLTNIEISAAFSDLLPRKGILQGHIRVQNIAFKKVRAEDVKAHLDWKNNGFIIEPLSASFYGGSLEGKITGSELTKVPQWQWDLQFNRIQLKPLLQDINKDSKFVISGLGQIKIQGSSQGKTRDQMLTHMNGMTEFSLKNGALEGIDLNYFVQTADALLNNKQEIDAQENSSQTVFNQVMATAIIKNGVMDTQDLLLVSPVFITKGKGSVLLPSGDLDLILKVLPEEQKDAKSRWEIPLLVTGKFSAPHVRLDSGEIQKFVVKREIEKIKNKARDQIKKHIPGKTGEFLQNLLSN